MAQLDEIVDEADPTAGDRRAEDRERRKRARSGRQKSEHSPEHDQNPPHRRGSLLHRVVLGPLLPDRLPERVAAQKVDEDRPCKQGDDQRHEGCDDDTCH